MICEIKKEKKHIDCENYCREKILLYVPFEKSEITLIKNLLSWEVSYLLHDNTIKTNESNFTSNIKPLWCDLENAIQFIKNSTIDAIDTMKKKRTTEKLTKNMTWK